MKKQLFCLMLLGMILLSVSSVSALELNPFAEKKIYEPAFKEDLSNFLKEDFNSDYGVIRLSKTFFWFESDRIAEYSLIENTEICIINCEAKGKAKLYQEGTLFEDINFKTLRGKNTEIQSWELFIFGGLKDNYVDVPIYEKICKDIVSEKNATYNNCIDEIVGYESENQPIEIWNAYNGETLPPGDYVWKLKGKKLQGQSVDFIPLSRGFQFEEWAVWSEGLNNNLRGYWTMNETSGTTAYDSLGLNNGTLTANALFDSSGLIAYAGKYDGSGNAIIDLNYKPLATDTDITFSFWQKSGIDSHQVVCFKGTYDCGTPNSDGDFRIYTGGDGTWVSDWHDGTGRFQATSPAMSSGVWSMITFVINQTTISGYMNGNKGTSVSASSFTWTGADEFYPWNLDGAWTSDTWIDEIAIWNRTLTQAEITDLYNGGVGLTYRAEFTTPPTITLNSPANATKYTNSPQTIIFNCSASDNLEVANATLFINGIANYTQSGGGLNFTEIYQSLSFTDGDYNWTCNAFDNEDTEATTETRYFSIDSVAPILTLNSPLTNFTTLTLPINVTLNFTASDSNLDSCWFSSSINSTNTTFTCNTNQTISFNSSGAHSFNYYANDTFGLESTGTAQFYIYYVQPSATATNPITEGGFSNFTLYVNMSNITNWNPTAYLVWNGTNYGAGTKTNVSSDSVRFDKTLVAPSLNTTSVNWTWYYNISGNPNVVDWNVSGTQTYIYLNISECGAGTYQILNYTLYDQKTKVIADGSLNGSIETDLTLSSYANSSLTWNFHTTKNGSNNLLVCLPSGALNNSEYQLDSIAKYSYENHVVQYHYIVNFKLNSSTIPQTIKLYDLATAESTSFLINYQDENYLYVEDAIIDVWRRYVGDGVFFSVEHGKTDAQGQTRLHLVTEDIIYKFLVWIDGELVYTSPEYLALCQATPCQINLRKTIDESTGMSERDNIVYAYSFNKTTRTATFDFSTKDGTETTMNMTILSSNAYENETACSTILTTSGGQISCAIPLSFTNTSYQTLIFKDGEYFGTSVDSLAPGSMELFGYTGIILTAIAYLFLALMGISSGIATIIFGIIGLVFMGLIQMFESGSIFGLASAIIWLIVAGVIIIFKITKRRIQ